jgi:methyl-branched lipid omega-hydroxylase
MADEGFNPADLSHWANGDVEAKFARLRQRQPVAWHEHSDTGRGFWSITRHADIAAVNTDHQRFTNRAGVRISHDPEMGLIRPASDSMTETDPPEHTMMRKLVSRGFTPRSIQRFLPLVEARVRRVIDSLPKSEPFNFVTMAAAPLDVIGDIVGVPEADRRHLYDLTNRSFGDGDPDLSSGREDGSAAIKELKAYGLELARQRQARPQDDLTTQLVSSSVDGRPLTPVEMGGFLSLLIAAGNETTRNALTLGMHAFSQNPDQKLCVEDAARASTLSEEVLRWATPLASIRREVAQPVEFGGVQMRPGDKVVLWYISGNRDETVFAQPGQFDITRDARRQQAFGGGGPHYCLGSNLARLEIEIFFRELFRSFPDIRATGEPSLIRSNQFRAATSLEVQCTV